MSGRNSVYLYENWCCLCTVPLGACLTPKDITGSSKSSTTARTGRLAFLKARLERLDEDEVFSFDATNIAAEALEIEDACDSKGKKSVYAARSTWH